MESKSQAIFSSHRWSTLDRIIFAWRSYSIKKLLKEKKSVCDLGCGEEGYLLQKLAQRIPICIGFDLHITNAHPSPKITLMATDLEKPIPLAESTVEAVLSLAVIEHLSNYQQHIEEARRILTSGGIFIVTTPSPLARPILGTLAFLALINTDSIKDHKRYFSKKMLIDSFKKAGFSNVTFNYFQIGCNQRVIAIK